MRQPLTTRTLAHSALAAAVAVVLALAGAFLPVAGEVLLLGWGIPLTIIHLRHGARASGLTLVTALLLLGLILGLGPAVFLVTVSGLAGLALGEALRRKSGPGSCLLWTTGGWLVGLAVIFFVATGVTGLSLIDGLADSLHEGLDVAVHWYSRLGVPEEQVSQMREVWTQLLAQVPVLAPGLAVLSAVFGGFLYYLLAGAVLSRLGERVEPQPPFAQWRLPRVPLLAAFLLGMGLILVHSYFDLALPFPVGMNLYFVAQTGFLIQGLSTAYFYLARWRLPRWGRVLALLGLYLNPFLRLLAGFLGMFELIFNFRRL